LVVRQDPSLTLRALTLSEPGPSLTLRALTFSEPDPWLTLRALRLAVLSSEGLTKVSVGGPAAGTKKVICGRIPKIKKPRKSWEFPRLEMRKRKS
jgi:hypothetical protein